MKKINSFLLIFGLLFGATACTNWLSEDGAPKMTYDYYGTEQGVVQQWLRPIAFCVGDVVVNDMMC